MTISRRLVLYFSGTLVIFGLIIGSVFTLLFRSYTMDLHKKELSKRAVSISQNMAAYMESSFSGGLGNGQGYGMGGYRAYLRFLGEMAGTDVWIVDTEHNLMMSGSPMCTMLSELPPNAGSLIESVFNDGEIAFGEGFSGFFEEPTLTAAAPIRSERIGNTGSIIGVVLLHLPVQGTNDAVVKGLTLLCVSIAAAFIIAAPLSMWFSYGFTRPLGIMKNTANALANGDYTAKNDIQQPDEIGSLAQTIDALAERLDIADQQSRRLEALRREFFANVSHELKTPVTVLTGSLEALADGVVTDPSMMADYHRQMLLEARFLQRLVGDLLDLSKLSNTDFVIEKSEVCLNDIIEDAVRSASRLAEQKRVRIRFEHDGHCILLGDYGRLKQMLLIVLDNGVKFSPEAGSVEVRLTNADSDAWRLTVADEGEGITEQDIPYIFERFYKSRSEQNKTGTGLGLAIAKQIAERHGIGLSVQSEHGNGAKFIFDKLLSQTHDTINP